MTPSTSGFRVVLAAGGVVWRRTPSGVEIAVIRRTRYGEEWSLPKGKVEPGETFEQTAIREVREETCCDAVIRDFVGSVDYLAKKRPKVVLFYDMELEKETPFEPNDEVKQIRWVEPAEALGMLTYKTEIEVLKRWRASEPGP